MTHRAYIAMGSNLGDRGAALRAALEMLDETPGVTVAKVSTMIETAPVGPPGQGPYLNAAAALDTALAPRALLDEMHRIEAAMGRDRSREQRWGARTCDLDLLLYDDETLETDELTIPHPYMHERSFMLAPLAEIAPDARHPRLGKTIAELMREMK